MKPHPKVNPPKILPCPYCGNKTTHILAHREDFSELIAEANDGSPIWDERWLATLVCSTCRRPSIYRDEWDGGAWVTSLAYPTAITAPKEAPPRIRETFDEALSVLHRSPSLAAVGIRKCLEGICDHQNAQGKTLAQRIAFLASNGAIPRTLGEMMDASRTFGNIGAHFGDTNVTRADGQILVEFARAVLEYIYVAPARVESVRKRLESPEAGEPGSRDTKP